MRRIPLWLKIAWTAWLAVWVPIYYRELGPQNFLWFCDLGNFMIGAALWLESPLLMSWQAVSVLLVQLAWCVDFLVRWVAGFHPIGGTEYMFRESYPIHMRLLSLFHMAAAAILIWGLWRLKYDRRALLFQCVTAWVVLPVCFMGWGPEKDINWVWGLFDKRQTFMNEWLFLGACMIGYPVILYLPSHLIVSRIRWFRAGNQTVSA